MLLSLGIEESVTSYSCVNCPDAAFAFPIALLYLPSIVQLPSPEGVNLAVFV